MTVFTDWLADPSAQRVLLVEVKTYSGAAEITRYIASDTFITSPTDSPANTHYEKRLTGSPFFERRMSEAFGGKSFASIGKIELDNSDGALDSWITDAFDGRDIILKLGSPDWDFSAYETILTGVVERLVVTSNAILSLIIKDNNEVIFFISNNKVKDMLAVWTDSKAFVTTLRSLFSLMWKKSHHIDETDAESLLWSEITYEHR